MLRHIAFIIVLFTVSALQAQVRTPKIGYVCPAGGQRGTTFEILIGGRQIARCTEVLISGTGVRGKIVRGYSQMGIVGSDDSQVARYMYDEARKRVESDKFDGSITVYEAVQQRIDEEIRKFKEKNNEDLALPKPAAVATRHPYLHLLAEPNADAVQTVFYEYYAPRQTRRPPEFLGQGVHVEITIDPDAEPGDRDLRVLVGGVLSPPVRFQVGTQPEILEIEPNDAVFQSFDSKEIWGRYVSQAPKSYRQLETLELPIVVNGQIRGGDVDRFTFRAVKGQKLVLGVRARHLVPYLADGVPGWFEAVVTLFGPDGKKIAGASSYRFDPDPVLMAEIPEDGTYAVEIQDSIFRGREDFVYRLSIGEAPFVTSVFPLGGSNKSSTGADIDGWNLPAKIAVLETDKKTGPFGKHYDKDFLGSKKNAVWLPYPIRYAADSLPEHRESEPNNSASKANRVKLPVIVNGRIDSSEDVDFYSFAGKKGETVVLDVVARSLNSPLDASLELFDSDGKRIAQNDDRADCNGPNIGLETHHADPYIMTELPKDGVYTVRLYNVLQRGGPAFGYRLRISKPRPDFEVYCEPASVNFIGPVQPLAIRVVRKDGFNGEINLQLHDNNGFRLDGGRIPPGVNRIDATLSSPAAWNGKPATLQLQAAGKNSVRNVTAVDDWEQAFIYHHLVPAESLMVARPSSRRGSLEAGFARPAEESQLLDRKSGEATFAYSLPPIPKDSKGQRARLALKSALDRMTFALHNAPAGLTLERTEIEEQRIVFHVRFSESASLSDGNLIVAVSLQGDPKKNEITPIGVLPAFSFRFK